ncbi:MAG TPA: acyltransferase domain-containing protein, partial [Candidatus Methylacidiphilales bacterium]|nr:acyltransferase domain-containing protein [Candidatus Methylacidiphilales bacterium]
TDKKAFCAIGSVKGNVGHLNSAAGIASLIKVALALKNEKIPPSLNFTEPNPKIDFADSPFFVNTKLADWKRASAPRRAGVSSFGLGGTNAHVVLEEAPITEPSGLSRAEQLLVFSARSAAAVDDATANFAAYLKEHPGLNLADAAYTLQTGRRAFPHRRIVACRDSADAIKALEARDPKRVVTQKAETKEQPVVFMFPGQGSQYVNMGLELYRSEPVFKAEMDRCAELLLPHLGVDLRSIIYPASEKAKEAEARLTETRFTQPALFSIEYALAKLWISWGIMPQAMIGHSIGEYVAACLAGVFTLEEALRVVANRARLIQEQPRGSMLAVRVPEDELAPLLPKELCIAVINSPSLCVVSGPSDAITDFEAELKTQGIPGRRIETSHAFHSAMMEPAVEPLTRVLEKVSLKAPAIPYISNLTGQWITSADARRPGYWASHMRQAVRFADGLAEVMKNPDAILLEVGPGRNLATFANQHPARNPNQLVLTSFSAAKDKELAAMLTALGSLWAAGKPVDWTLYYEREKRRRIPLPTYPFQRERYWIEPKAVSPVARAATAQPIVTTPTPTANRHARPEIDTTFAAPASASERTLAGMWQELFNLREIGLDDDFFALGGDSLLAMQFIGRLNKTLGFHITPPVFLQHSTVRKLAALYDKEMPTRPEAAVAPLAKAASPAASINRSAPDLIPFQEKGNHPPLFFIHGDWAGGGIYCGRLSRRLGEDQPLYALSPYRSGKPEVLDLNEMVEHHLSVIRAHTPHGPYLIGGYCVGAKVAVEVARKLVEQGEDVRHLFLVDLPQPFVPWQHRIWPSVDKLGKMMGWPLLKRIRFFDRYPISVLRWFRRSNANKWAPLSRRLGLSRSGHNPEAMGFEVNEFNAEILDSLDYALYFLASCQHDVKPLAIPAALYFSDESFPRNFRLRRSRETFRDFTLEMVPGNHHTCITTYVNATAERLGETLARLFPASGSTSSRSLPGELTRAA